MRLNFLGINHQSVKSSKRKTIPNHFLCKRTNPRETYTRGEYKRKPFDLDYAEDEQLEQGQLKKPNKMAESQPKIAGDYISSQKLDNSASKIMLANKTRQSVRPYQSRDLRIKNRPGRTYKQLKRGKIYKYLKL